MSPVQQSWNRLRSLFKDALTFAQIKDAVGSGGLDTNQLAHLQQGRLPNPGASKGDLLDAIGRLLGESTAAVHAEVLEAVIGESLRKCPQKRREVDDALGRCGISLSDEGRLIFSPDQYEVGNAATAAPAAAAPRRAPSVFVSYSHVDSAFKDELLIHLKPFHGTISPWSDDEISPGSEWFRAISESLNAADIAVLLVTSHFLASDFIREHELGPLFRRHSSGQVTILWVPVRACNWEETPLKHIQAAISPSKPLAEMQAERDRAWVEICKQIKRALPK